MKSPITCTLTAGLVALALPALALAQSENYPAKTVRIVAPFPPGGSVDTVGRLIAARLAESYGQQFVIDNRPGASGNIGMEIAANALADGYTLVVNTIPLVTNQLGRLAIRQVAVHCAAGRRSVPRASRSFTLLTGHGPRARLPIGR